jgi:hypothetical protein
MCYYSKDTSPHVILSEAKNPKPRGRGRILRFAQNDMYDSVVYYHDGPMVR